MSETLPNGPSEECAVARTRKPFDTARSATIGDAREAMLDRLNILFDRATKGPWKPYQDGVHPVDVGPMGSGEDFAICQGFGPNLNANCDWIAAIHNDWPMIVDLIEEYRALDQQEE